MNERGSKGPWEQLGKLEPSDEDFIDYENHPSQAILKSYLKGNLPKDINPDTERLSKLSQGYIKDWSEREVASHVATCQKCKNRLYSIQADLSEAKNNTSLLSKLRNYLLGSPQTRINPALAGAAVVQFGLIIVLSIMLLTTGPFRQPKPSLVTPNVDLVSELERASLYVQFEPDTTVEEIEGLVKELNISHGSIQGPIEDGTYIVFVSPPKKGSFIEKLSKTDFVEKISKEK